MHSISEVIGQPLLFLVSYLLSLVYCFSPLVSHLLSACFTIAVIVDCAEDSQRTDDSLMAEKMIWRRRPAQLYRCLRHLFQFRKICSEFRSRRCRDFHHHASSNPYRAKQQNFFSVQPIHPLSAAWSRLQPTAHQPAPFSIHSALCAP